MSNKTSWIITIFTILLGFGLFYWLLNSQDIPSLLNEISTFGIYAILGFIFISMTNFGLYALRWWLILRHIDNETCSPSWFNMYKHRMSGFALSYITPVAQAGGEPALIGMLMNDKVSGKRAVGSVTLDIAFELAFFTGFIFIGFLVALLEGVMDFNTAWFVLLFLALFLVFFLATWFMIYKDYRPLHYLYKRTSKRKHISKALKFLDQTEDLIVSFFHRKKKIVLVIMLLSMLVMSFRIVEVFFIGWGYGVNLTFGQAFLVSTLPGLALLIPVPAGIGVFEGGFSVILTILGISISPLAFVAIIRFRDLVFVSLGLMHAILVSRGRLISFFRSHYESR